MQLSQTKKDGTRGQESCSDVKPRIAWADDHIDIGFGCSHGTIIWVSMTPAEANDLVNQLIPICDEFIDEPGEPGEAS